MVFARLICPSSAIAPWLDCRDNQFAFRPLGISNDKEWEIVSLDLATDRSISVERFDMVAEERGCPIFVDFACRNHQYELYEVVLVSFKTDAIEVQEKIRRS